MIAQNKSYMPVSDDSDWIGASHHDLSTAHTWQGPTLKTGQFHFDRQFKGCEKDESDFDVHQQSKTVRPSLPDGLKQFVAGLIVFLTVTGGLSFVVWFFWTIVMGSSSFDTLDLIEVIRGSQ